MEQIIKKIIEDFNFEKVHKAMVATNWIWSNGVPTISELVVRATKLLKEASKMSPESSVGTGGFIATKCYNDELGEGLILEFILTQSEYYENE